MTRRILALSVGFQLLLTDLALAQAGGGSSSFGGGGGGGGGFSGGGGSSGSGSGGGDPIVTAIFFAFFGLVVIWLLVKAALYRRRVNARVGKVRRASAEAAEDDSYFAADQIESEGEALFDSCQAAWDRRDRDELRRLVGEDLMVEWKRRLDDFDSKGWHNRVEVMGRPKIQYVGLTNREDDTEDRVVIRIEAQLKSYVLTADGQKIQRKGKSSDLVSLTEYWTLARRDGHWKVVSIEQKSEGDHQLDAEIVASPWAGRRVADEALTEVAVADKLPEGFKTADLADFAFEDDAHAKALDLSLADARFGPDLLEAAARRAVEAWAEAVDGEDAPLERVASRETIDQLLYAGDSSRKTRLVVRGPGVRRIRIAAVDVQSEPATMSVEVDLAGRRYVEDRDTAAVLSGSKDRATTFTERWTLALAGPDDAPWQLVATSAAKAA
ncbi:MAG TPA: TIM44-like domain-containing protein [Thermoleophilaceae bacterium]